jgi:hypothetical protein
LGKRSSDAASILTPREDALDLKALHRKTNNTIHCLHDYMVEPDVPMEVLLQVYRKPTPQNLIKLLRKASGLFEMRTAATKILKSMAEIELFLKP